MKKEEIQIEAEDSNLNNGEDYQFTQDYVNPPYFDWEKAETEYGLEFYKFSIDGFSSFIKEKFLDELITLRKSYIKRDFEKVRFCIHKYKGSFK